MRNGRTIKYAGRLLLAVVIGLVILGSSPVPVQAQAEPVDLVLGGEGATAWSIEDIKPCHSGTKAVTLHNAGYEDGFVTIWITDTDSTEGLNPEPETDTEEPGELIDHLLFNLSTSPAGRLDTNISLPTTINYFPPSVSGPGYIWINPLNAGETVTLYWEWELPCETGNDAQGDLLSFTINYLLEELPPPPPPPGCPDIYGLEGYECYFKIDMLGKITRVDVDCCSNTVLGTRIAPDPDDVHFLKVERGTLVICEECEGCECYPQVVVMSLAEESPPLPYNKIAIGPIYDFKGYMDIERLTACAPVTFNSPISMVLSYDPDELPEGASAPVLAYYDADLSSWVELSPDPGRVAEVGKIAVLADYFKSPFAILVEVPSEPTNPAVFSLSNLNIVPSQSKTWPVVTFVTRSGEEVTITADITNSGGQEGTYTATLEINREVRGTREIVLGPGQSEQVVFTVSDNEPGQYTVVLGSLSGEFTTSRWINWWLIGGIIAALIILLGWLGWYRRGTLYRRWKRAAKPRA
jgi:hypothetical protein